MPATRDTYKGHPTLTLTKNGASERDRGMTFGVTKARLILAHVEEIERFVIDHQDDVEGKS